MNNWLIPLGLGAVVAAVVIATKKDNQPLPPARTRPNPLDNVRTRTPGRPGTVLTTIGPPPGWASMSDSQRATFCANNFQNPAWSGFCSAWIQAQPDYWTNPEFWQWGVGT